MSPAADADYLRRAIRLAMNGRGSVEPNPMVGCVIVKDGRIIGEGFHARFGGPHAEPAALAACREDPRGATAYVTLEPCCHTNKQTPPCVPRLIEAAIARVVIGCLDPNPEVNGRGAATLRAAGIVVEQSSLQAECKQLIAPFTARTVFERPYVTLKWAQTADGKIAGSGGRRMQISNERSMQAVHRLRANCDAILVGVNTVMKDDPLLLARRVAQARPLVRCVLDHRLRTPLQSRLIRTASESPVIIGCEPSALNLPVADALRSSSVELIPILIVGDMLRHLHAMKASHLLVEPGPTLARAFFDEGLADRLWVFDCPTAAGDNSAPAAASIPPTFSQSAEMEFNGDRLREYVNQHSSVFFAALPSADVELEKGYGS